MKFLSDTEVEIVKSQYKYLHTHWFFHMCLQGSNLMVFDSIFDPFYSSSNVMYSSSQHVITSATWTEC